MAAVRVVKSKWDGTVSAVSSACSVGVANDIWAWLVPAGSRRERPGTGRIEVVGTDELWVAVPGEWWVLCAYADAAGSLIGYMGHASAPFEPPRDDAEIGWIDLDLDFEVAGDVGSVRDEAEFHGHARTMAYPAHVVHGAWVGVATIAARFTNGDWPFDGSLDELASAVLASREVGRGAERASPTSASGSRRRARDEAARLAR
ncbi:hypothetical protein JCM18899A_25160 [Nocardioides sp. AN3]